MDARSAGQFDDTGRRATSSPPKEMPGEVPGDARAEPSTKRRRRGLSHKFDRFNHGQSDAERASVREKARDQTREIRENRSKLTDLDYDIKHGAVAQHFDRNNRNFEDSNHVAEVSTNLETLKEIADVVNQQASNARATTVTTSRAIQEKPIDAASVAIKFSKLILTQVSGGK